MDNRKVKQMMVDIVLKGRKLVDWQEHGEVFLCNSIEHLEETFHCGDMYFEDKNDPEMGVIFEKIPNPHKALWKMGYNDCTGNMEPVLSWCYGGKDDAVQISTTYY